MRKINNKLWKKASNQVQFLFITYSDGNLLGYRGDSTNYTIIAVGTHQDFEDDMVDASTLPWHKLPCVFIYDRNTNNTFLHGTIPDGKIGDEVRKWVNAGKDQNA